MVFNAMRNRATCVRNLNYKSESDIAAEILLVEVDHVCHFVALCQCLFFRCTVRANGNHTSSVRHYLSVFHGCSGMENDAVGSGSLFQSADRESFFVGFRDNRR